MIHSTNLFSASRHSRSDILCDKSDAKGDLLEKIIAIDTGVMAKLLRLLDPIDISNMQMVSPGLKNKINLSSRPLARNLRLELHPALQNCIDLHASLPELYRNFLTSRTAELCSLSDSADVDFELLKMNPRFSRLENHYALLNLSSQTDVLGLQALCGALDNLDSLGRCVEHHFNPEVVRRIDNFNEGFMYDNFRKMAGYALTLTHIMSYKEASREKFLQDDEEIVDGFARSCLNAHGDFLKELDEMHPGLNTSDMAFLICCINRHLQGPVDIHMRQILHESQYNYRPLIYEALKIANLDMLESLLQTGTDPELNWEEGEFLSLLAGVAYLSRYQRDFIPEARILISHGANVNAILPEGEVIGLSPTPLGYALEANNIPLAIELINAGADTSLARAPGLIRDLPEAQRQLILTAIDNQDANQNNYQRAHWIIDPE